MAQFTNFATLTYTGGATNSNTVTGEVLEVLTLTKEAATAARKMCVGVFGPSQSGKSYLISALAQDADGSLLAALGDESADFIQDINPAGGKESCCPNWISSKS